eukprot:8758224-Pyramimonas_sp.AAC.1
MDVTRQTIARITREKTKTQHPFATCPTCIFQNGALIKANLVSRPSKFLVWDRNVDIREVKIAKFEANWGLRPSVLAALST